MILKSSDKLIAIIGVIILIIAGIGIFIYISNEDDSEEDQVVKSIKKFKVEWIQEVSLPEKISNTRAVRDKPYNKPIEITVNKEPLSVLTFVDINLKWKDSCTGLILRNGILKLASDKLKAEFTFNGKSEKIPQHTGQGDRKISFSLFNEPTEEIIEDPEVMDENDALLYIQEKYSAMDSVLIETKVQITTGLFERIRIFRDKGENFNLQITYTYYYPVISEIAENEPPTDITPSGYQPPAYSMMCLPGML